MREQGEKDVRSQPPSQSWGKSKSKLYRIKKKRKPEAKGS